MRQYNNSLTFVDLIPWTFVGVYFIYDKCVDYAPELRLRDISTYGLVFNMKSICVGRWMIKRRATPAENPHLRVKVRNANIGAKSSALRIAVGFPRRKPHIGGGG